LDLYLEKKTRREKVYFSFLSKKEEKNVLSNMCPTCGKLTCENEAKKTFIHIIPDFWDMGR
jgi:hypothetical protein